MNNLLQSLNSQRLRLNVHDNDLKRLLSAVKDGRGHDSKLQDAFYDSLEGVLLELRTVTIDNHDAEAFLKPVSKTDYPDYYEIIKEPMDLQTMLRKVKQKQYKSKAEFQDDFDLIWSNCFDYNTGDNHPLRQCAKRLQQKANRLLKNITDRRDRLDPPVPSPIDATHPRMPNGVMVNGHSGHSRKHSAATTPVPKMPIVIKKSAPPSRTMSIAPPSPPPTRRDLTFGEQPAFVRTVEGMAAWSALDRELSASVEVKLEPENLAGPSRLPIADKLRQIIVSGSGSSESEEEDEFAMEPVNGEVGDKRKLAVNGDVRPRKKARTRLRSLDAVVDPVDLWWEVSTSSTLMTNALPTLTYPSSATIESLPPSPPLPPKPTRKKKKKRPPERQQHEPSKFQPKSLLGLINNNIRSLRRVRQIHDKFLILNLNSEDSSSNNGAAGPSGTVEPPDPGLLTVDDPEKDIQVDDRPWRSRETGLDVGERDANDCLRWMGTKVLEHSGFQSTSRAALDVFTGVATEYLFNVGRTLRYLCDKYSKQMSAEEIILHTLFESGITHIRDLERYITDDVLRYGTRLTELEKKLANAYNEVTVDSALDDDAFFNEDEEEENELVMGNFADAFGDDFLGLRELGIASELGLSSLTIPKKLLRGKNKNQNAQKGAKPSEPPPPYPPPSPFTPLDSASIDHQIGLLRPFYIHRINSYAGRTHPSQPLPYIFPPAPAPSQLEIELAREMGTEPPTPQAPPPIRNPAVPGTIVLPDEQPPVAKTKSGPLGQIVRPSASALAGAAKKKAKSGSGVGGGGGAAGSGSAGGGAAGGAVGGATAKGSIYGPAGPGPGIPPPSIRAADQWLPNGPIITNANGSLAPPVGAYDGYAVLPGSAGVGVGVGVMQFPGEGGGKKTPNPNASPKKKSDQGQQPPSSGSMLPFVAANA
ncbi:hypothetical protein A7U60_g7200 [Sanghuangporus baumii]|uniref:Bromo domain-containing protein n=1 Tax=Sanghuangporus baumii TaxID=108892 RepID=A0A9Q5N5Q4_SANBA|nr:hypothetical protein A7U60_g7200 [Sanghuangporus baumii]